ncbi:TetR family transcriptional regulator [Vitiosangium sp. GDMCC 1.1324]|uniref:TetR family transcriptional regulator n=1 Tax=Vitiosangium sp. (strain GDMCC 1.1324) TaxID=2138576 RepID=UPI000D38A1CD|nr:TetR family transcriptional regulator [Vitiosangium sp. GDMCC 1.1324]PTL78955.1 TetR family transcriptional regulator [Vitiosangium sp. GDMCC 1.1324]
MARWEPNARGRLEQAAMELFQERGYVRTTVEEIAARAGLTERTFFRYFTDKREVLFSGSSDLQKLIADTTTDAPKETAPLDAVAAALEAAAASLQQHRDESYVQARHALVVAHAELRERELIKLASLASAVAHALRKRGVAEPAASLTAEAGIAVFKVAFERWVTGTEPRDLSQHVRMALDELRAVTAGTARTMKASRHESPRRHRTSK